MADLFEIVGRVSLDGIDDAERELNGLTSTGERTSNKFGKVMSAIGKTVLAVGTAVGAGSVALVKGVSESFGELQQNLGGSEAVFGKYAKNVQKIAEDAYKNMGMSQSEYLATANKMGSLLQGSGIKQKEALDMTAEAMQRASDVASVMGIDMEMAMESIAGACKGNFTMMDNLGVAMNATTLEAYAHAKGIEDFTWKTATQAEKNSLAMQMFLERTQQYAGNFARESEDTISGSIGYLGASWKDFMAGLGNPTADMAKLTNNLAQSFGAMINNIVPIIENITKSLPIVLPSIVNAISDLAPTLIKTFTDVITKMINSIIPLLPTVIPLFVDMIVKIGMALAQNAPVLIDGFVQLITQLTVAISQQLPELIPIFIDCMIQIAGAIAENAPIILDAILGIAYNFETGLSPAISACVNLIEILTTAFIAFKVGSAIQGVVQGFQSAQVALALFSMETHGASVAQGLLNGQLTFGQTVVALLTGKITLAELATALWAKTQAVLNGVLTANPIGLIVMAIGAVIAILVVAYNKSETFRNLIDKLWAKIKEFGSKLIDWAKGIPNAIKSAFNTVINFVKNNWQGLLLMIVSPFAGAFKLLYDNCDGFRNFIDGFITKVKTFFKNGIDAIVTFFSQSPEQIGYHIGLALGKVTRWAVDMALKAKETGKNFINNVVNFFKTLPSKVSSFITSTITKVATWQINMALKATQAGKNFINNVVNYIKTLPSKVATWLTNTVSKISTFASNAGKKASEAGKKMLNNVVDGVKNLPSRIKSIGSDVVKGLWSGITGAGDWLKKKVTGFCSGIVDGFKKGFDSHSPARKLMPIGNWVTQGLGVGITEDDSAEQSIQDKVDNIIGIASNTDAKIKVGTSVDDIVKETPLQKYQVDFNAKIDSLNDGFDNLIALIGQYLPNIANNMDRDIVLDGNSLVVGMSRRMDAQLGKISTAKGRGNV